MASVPGQSPGQARGGLPPHPDGWSDAPAPGPRPGPGHGRAGPGPESDWADLDIHTHPDMPASAPRPTIGLAGPASRGAKVGLR